jgi:hypothetical protein
MRHPHPLTRIAFAALAVVVFPLWLYGRARWRAEIDAARRLRKVRTREPETAFDIEWKRRAA